MNGSATTVDGEAFSRLFRSHAASVAIITTVADGVPVGFTATSVVSVSAAPAVIAFSVNRTSSSHHALRSGVEVLAHFLDAVHTRIADVFATSGLDRFAAADWCWDEAGLPRLAGVDARARAVITRTIEAGSSELFIAELLTARAPEAREPLIYLDRRYRALAELTPTSS